MSEDYNLEVQKLFLQFLITEHDLWVRCGSILDPEYFHKSLRKVVFYLKDYAEKYNGVPKPSQISAQCNVELDLVPDITDSDRDWLIQNLEQFCRHRALELWCIKGMDLVQEGKYGALEAGLKDALLISLYKNLGTKYFENPKERLLKIRENNGQVSTGLKALDEKLYGGFNRGELNIFAGGSGSGKSLFLQNIAINWALSGLNVVYISLELSEELVSMRMDSMVSGISSREIFKKIDDVDTHVRYTGRDAGNLYIKYVPQGSTTNHIKSYLKEVEIQEGRRPDALIIDYLDLLHPNDKRINPSDLFIKDKFVSEELRGVATEGNGPDHRLLLVTASQLNRSAVEEGEYSHANIAGGLSKIQTADNVFGIFTSRIYREQGRYQLQLMKTRNSAGVGEKINLGFNINTLRITDLEEDIEDEETSVFTKLKKKDENEETEETTSKPKAKTKDVMALIKEMKNKN